MNKPKYPIYVISKGRHDCCLTANFMEKDGIDYHLVVEPQEAEKYIARYGHDKVYILPFSNLGLGSIPARNWVWEHAKDSGAKRHWIFDDNIRSIQRRWKAHRIKCNGNPALAAAEEFTDRYENIAISGLNYSFNCPDRYARKPFFLNVHVYSCLLILNSLTQRWRGRYNEDTDLCLQVLANNWCTVLFNTFLIEKMATMKMKGGNMDELYKGDGRLRMARSLEQAWPHIVETKRRFKRPQHVVKNQWRSFNTQLKRRTDIDWDKIKKTNEFGLKLKYDNVKHDQLKKLINDE